MTNVYAEMEYAKQHKSNIMKAIVRADPLKQTRI